MKTAALQRPLVLFEGRDGAFTSARGLTPDEAVDAYDRGHLSLLDVQDLTIEAAEAVLAKVENFDVRARAVEGSVVVFGVRKPTFARHGRA